MKRISLRNHACRLFNLSAHGALLSLPLLLACSSSGSGGSGEGGSTSASGGATSSGSGGASTGQGGNTASGGSTSASGGSTNANGGNTAKGGSSSESGGNTAKGGSTGSGGSTNQSGGSTSTTGGNTAKGGGTGTAGAGGGDKCPTDAEEKFSFFLTSNAGLIRESGKADGFGGGLGGLEGADKICQHIAEFVSPCQKNKVWHAFLSTSTVNAIDRVGSGPWYDRNGRLVSMNKTDLVQDRPGGADAAIKNDLPNENGVPNHNPDGTGQVDNHEVLTGSGTDGKVYALPMDMGGTGGRGGMGGGFTNQCGADAGQTGMGTWSVERATCWGWTRATEEGCPRAGHSWPRQGSGTNWISVWNEGGCAPGGTLSDTGATDGTRRVGAGGGYGGYYCFAVIPHP